MVQHPDDNVDVLAALFRQMRCEACPTIQEDGTLSPEARPWARQTLGRLQDRSRVEAGQQLLDYLDAKPLRLRTDADIKEDVLRIDLRHYRANLFLERSAPAGALLARHWSSHWN